MQNTELLTIADGGIQTVIPELATVSSQIIYLDFDGEMTSYHNRDLDIHIDDVEVEDSGLTQERIASIGKALNDDFADQNVIFVTERPTDTDYSTIYVGKTSSFDEYGNFAGLAETVDIGNKIKNDNAFVMLDEIADDSVIIETITHEARHLIGTLEHSLEGIEQFAYTNIYNQTFTGDLNSGIELSHYSSSSHSIYGETPVYYYYDKVENARILAGGTLRLNWTGATVNNVIVYNGGLISGGLGQLNNITISSGGALIVGDNLNVDNIFYSGGALVNGQIFEYSNRRGLSLSLNQATFSGNNLDSLNNFWGGIHGGGAIQNYGQISISSANFSNNYTSRMGGAIYNDYSAIFSIENGVFFKNSANGNGGGVLNGYWANHYSATYFSATNVTFQENTANSGGGFFNDGYGHVTLLNGTFNYNRAQTGGAIGQEGGTFVIDTAFFEGNVAIENGGAIYQSWGGRVTLNQGEIKDNTANFGAGIYNGIGGTATITNLSFQGNIANSNGGGIYNVGSASYYATNYSFVTLSDVTFTANKAEKGGAIYNEQQHSIVNLTDVTFNTESDTIWNGGVINLNGSIVINSELTFDISEKSSCSNAMVTNFDVISGTPSFSVNVSSSQAKASYVLASNASQFDGAITVKNDDEKIEYGELVVNSILNLAEYSYSLIRNNADNLIFIVGDRKEDNVKLYSGEYLESAAKIMSDKELNADKRHYMVVSSDGVASRTIVNSSTELQVSSGGIARTVVVNSGGILNVEEDGILEGEIRLKGGKLATTGEVDAADAEIVFDLTQNLPDDDIMVDGLGNLVGGTFSVNVSADQQNGQYLLANGAFYFHDDVAIRIDGQPVTEIFVYDYETGGYNTLKIGENTFSLVMERDTNELLFNVNAGSVKLYKDEELTSAAAIMSDVILTKDCNNLMVVSNGGTAIGTTLNSDTRMVVSDGGIAREATIHSGGIIEVNEGSILEGRIEIGGKLTTTGEVDATDAEIVFDLTQQLPDDDIMVDNLGDLVDASYSISVSSTDVKEGKYLLAGGAEGFQSDVTFSVDGGMCLAEEYAGQYTFIWKDLVELEGICLTLNPGRYTGINYNGYNYVLTIEKGNLYLNVKKNVETMVLYLDGDDETIGKKLKEIILKNLVQEAVCNTTGYDRCIVVHADSFKGTDYYYRVVCGSAPSEEIKNELVSNESLSLKSIIKGAERSHKANNYTLLVWDHGNGINGLCVDVHSKAIMNVMSFAEVLSSSSMSSVCFDACLMSSVEVMAALSECSNLKYVIASAELTKTGDLNYKKLFSEYVNGNDIVQSYYQLFNSETISKLDIQSINELLQRLDNIGKCILDVIDFNDNEIWRKIENAVDDSLTYGDYKLKEINRFSIKKINGKEVFSYGSTDLGDFLKKLAIIFENKSQIKKAIDGALEGIPYVVCQLEKKDKYRQTSGLSVYFPIKKNEIGFQIIKKVMPYNWRCFVERIIEKTYLSEDFSFERYIQKNTVQNDREQMLLGVFSGEGTMYSDLFVNDSSTDFSFVLNNAGGQNDRIVLDILEGTETIAWSLLDSDGESIRDGDGLEIALSGLAAGTYVLSVTSENPAVFNLAFKADWSSAQDYIDDLYPNNAIDTAFEIDGMSLTGLLVSASLQDWFAFEMETFPNVITISSEASEQMKVSVYDEEGALVSELERQPNGDYVFSTSDTGFICVESLSGEKICYNLVSDFDMSIIDNAMSLLGDSSALRWWNIATDVFRRLEISTDNFESSISIDLTGDGLGLLNLPSNTYQWRLYIDELENWLEGNEIIAETSQTTQLLEAEKDGNADAFFVKPLNVWDNTYCARHVGIDGGWDGMGEEVVLAGKNKIEDVFAGSDDASILLLTDDANGDALFIDDIYSVFPEGIDAQARLANIDEIRAGAGDDIVDLTSQRFAYVGGDMTVRGGLGDDVIWANNGDNALFGDAGDDRIVGAGGNDVIVGGSGDDSLHGGGGEDIFAFGGNWGNDSVEQLEDGKVTLWFEDGSLDKWDAASLTYRDGDKSVTVSGVAAENISLKFGDDGSEQYGKLLESGAFDEFSSERIFENKNTRGMLA